jgi:TRAP-type C4-dicarboxylate transport system permease small subunit
MGVFLRVVDSIDFVAKVVAASLAAVIVAVMLAQVFFRYIINSSLQWSEELAIWGLIWMVFIGSVVLLRHWGHIGIPTFVNLLPLRARVPLILLSKIVSVVFLMALVYYGIQVFNASFHAESISMGHISTRWVKVAIPIGAGLMVILAIYSIAEDVRRWLRGDLEHFRRFGSSEAE